VGKWSGNNFMHILINSREAGPEIREDNKCVANSFLVGCLVSRDRGSSGFGKAVCRIPKQLESGDDGPEPPPSNLWE
jgi:hypothetical protein